MPQKCLKIKAEREKNFAGNWLDRRGGRTFYLIGSRRRWVQNKPQDVRGSTKSKESGFHATTFRKMRSGSLRRRVS